MTDDKKFIDDIIEHKDDDIEKIQTKPNMYISYLGSRGALHLSKELINNAIDECINQHSPGDTIEIYLDETENIITVSDNGRGIPTESLQVVCTKLQSGSKFERTGTGGASAGENGVGLTACNALSDKFEIIVYRYGEKNKISFEKGKQIGDIKTTKISNKDKHGTTFVLQPSKFFMGEECDIITDDLIEWLDKIVYLTPSDLTIKLSVKKKGKESVINKKYINKYGLYDYVKKLCKKPILDPLHFIDTMKLKEQTRGKEYDRFIGLEVAFTYDSSSMDFKADSFCNFINTIDNGVHVDAVKQGIMQYLSKQTRESLSERESKKLDITFADVSQGLVLTVYLQTDLPPQFTGQTKEKLSSNEFFKPLRDMTYRALTKFFKENPKELKKTVDKVKTNAKARIESTKVRNSVIRGETTNFDEHLMGNFEPANNTGKNQYRELFIIEGKSAMGSSRTGRFDRDTQALFMLRGVPLNAFGVQLDKVLLNAEFNSLVKILGCNIGERFDINKLRYNKIIIMSDSDSDGYNISSLVCAFFLTHLPELVKQGYLYKAVAPLYRIKSKYKEFILDKKEYVKIFERQVRENIILTKPYTGDSCVYSDEELENILYKNRYYLEELERVSNHLAVDPLLLEYIVIHQDDKDFKKQMKKKYPELDIDEQNVLSGILNNHFQILIMDELFHKRIQRIHDFVHNVNKNSMYYQVYEQYNNSNEDRGVMTLGQLLMLCQKFQPPIITRYKGLGELNPQDLCNTTLDPTQRILIRMTIKDIEKDLSQFNILHGNDSDERKLLMEHFKINREDLDN